MVVYASSRFGEHMTPPGHPERMERAEVFDRVAARCRAAGDDVREPRQATREELARVHAAEHLDAMAGTSGRAVMLDEDTFTSPESHEIALLAAGAAIDAALSTWSSGIPALALVRPPGHHATPTRAMGFCLYSNIAAAAAAVRAAGARRVAIVDIDVHHGNGTQAIFYADPDVLFVSLQQYPYWPGTGAADERGSGPGLETTVNVPMAAGAADADYERAFRDAVLPALDAFQPEAILVSAGFDAHEDDPLGGLRVTTQGYAWMVRQLDAAAARLCGRRIALVTEGGYDLAALEACLDETVLILR